MKLCKVMQKISQLSTEVESKIGRGKKTTTENVHFRIEFYDS